MKETPILFNADMVRALLDGRKTQTRRLVKPQPHGEVPSSILPGWYEPIRVGRDGIEFPGPSVYGFASEYQGWRSPFGAPGDRLWVRETWAEVPCSAGCEKYPDGFDPTIASIKQPGAPNYGWRYRATWDKSHSSHWKPSIHMPRGACRLTLDVTAVRVERLQDISDEDAKAEGVEPGCLTCGENCSEHGGCGFCRPDYRDSFIWLWNSIYGKQPGCDWSSNPWVWVCEFTQREAAA